MPNSGNQHPVRPPEKPTLSWPQTPAPAAPATASKPAAKTAAPAARYTSASLAGAALGGLIVGMLLIVGFQRLPSGTSGGAAEKASDAKTEKTSSPASGAVTKAGAPADSTTGYSGDSFALASEQSAGRSVSLSSISVSAPTWVVVYDDSNGIPGNALGAALFAPEVTSGNVRLLRATESGKRYFVGLQTDDGDRVFSLHGDAQVIDPNGRSVLASFMVQ